VHLVRKGGVDILGNQFPLLQEGEINNTTEEYEKGREEKGDYFKGVKSLQRKLWKRRKKYRSPREEEGGEKRRVRLHRKGTIYKRRKAQKIIAEGGEMKGYR